MVKYKNLRYYYLAFVLGKTITGLNPQVKPSLADSAKNGTC